MTGQGQAGQTVVSQHQLDVLVLAMFFGLIAVVVVVLACALVSALVGARGQARSRVSGGRR